MVPLNQELLLEGRISSQEGKKVYSEGYIKDQKGKTLAKAKVLFILIGERVLDQLKKNAMSPNNLPQ